MSVVQSQMGRRSVTLVIVVEWRDSVTVEAQAVRKTMVTSGNWGVATLAVIMTGSKASHGLREEYTAAQGKYYPGSYCDAEMHCLEPGCYCDASGESCEYARCEGSPGL